MVEKSFEIGNQAPIFSIKPLNEYFRRKQVDEEIDSKKYSIEPIPFSYHDPDGNKVIVDLQCLTCLD